MFRNTFEVFEVAVGSGKKAGYVRQTQEIDGPGRGNNADEALLGQHAKDVTLPVD